MSSAEQRDEQYSSWVGLIYVFNLIVGTGALALPAVFAKAGWALSIAVLIMLAFMGFVTVTFIIEVMACANALLQLRRIQSHKIDGESEVMDSSASEADADAATEETPVMAGRSRYYTLNRRVEVGDMTQLFFSRGGNLLFYAALCVYLYGDLAIYAAAIGRTMCDLVCESRMAAANGTEPCWSGARATHMDVYRAMLAVFVCVVGPFSYFNLQKTKYLQIATSSLRWCAFTVMLSIALVTIAELGAQGRPPAAAVAHVPRLLGVCVYSFMCHHSLPGLVAPFRDKTHVLRQLALDYALICAFYVAVALSGSFAFAELQDLYTLNFTPARGDRAGWLTRAVDYFLTLFPVFTLSTNFPIIAITLQSNLKALFLDTAAPERHHFALRRLLFPTLAVVPPVLVALATHNLDSLVAFTGTYAGSAIQYLVPACLALCARRACARDLGSAARNKYASPFQGGLWLLFVIVWCVACVSLSTINLFFYSSEQ